MLFPPIILHFHLIPITLIFLLLLLGYRSASAEGARVQPVRRVKGQLHFAGL